MAIHRHGDGNGGCAFAGAPGLGNFYASDAAADVLRDGAVRLPDGVPGPCLARLLPLFLSHLSFVENYVWTTYPVICFPDIKTTDSAKARTV